MYSTIIPRPEYRLERRDELAGRRPVPLRPLRERTPVHRVRLRSGVLPLHRRALRDAEHAPRFLRAERLGEGVHARAERIRQRRARRARVAELGDAASRRDAGRRTAARRGARLGGARRRRALEAPPRRLDSRAARASSSSPAFCASENPEQPAHARLVAALAPQHASCPCAARTPFASRAAAAHGVSIWRESERARAAPSRARRESPARRASSSSTKPRVSSRAELLAAFDPSPGPAPAKTSRRLASTSPTPNSAPKASRRRRHRRACPTRPRSPPTPPTPRVAGARRRESPADARDALARDVSSRPSRSSRTTDVSGRAAKPRPSPSSRSSNDARSPNARSPKVSSFSL